MRALSILFLTTFLSGSFYAQSVPLLGRRVMTVAEVQKQPFCYVGRLVNKSRPNSIGGTATLVGPRHIVTAAHVVLDIDELQAKGNLGPMIFVLPDGRSSEIVESELDGGFPETRLSSFDFGICKLQDPLGSVGHAKWGVFEDADFGKKVMMTGYDQDLAGTTRPPPLIERTGRVNQQKGGHTVTVLGIAALLEGVQANRFSTTVGGASLALAGLGLNELQQFGWKSEFIASQGASGGPIWIDRNGVPTVVGVQSGGPDINKDRIVDFSLGSTISSGGCESMVRDYIARNP